MSRWKPDPKQRLQAAAMALFQERGYEGVNVAEIAEKAGLTRRTFFNHFADKREIFFSGAAAFCASVAEHLDAVPPDIKAFDAATTALTDAGIGIGDYRQHAPAVHLLVESSAELTERNLAKMKAVTQTLADGLIRRSANSREAQIAAGCAVAAYQIAWLEWGQHPDEDFTELMNVAVTELRSAVLK